MKTDYDIKAENFLKHCNATIKMEYVGDKIPNWDNLPHRMYFVEIETPRSKMQVEFYDSLNNTNIHNLSQREYYQKMTHRNWNFASLSEKENMQNELKQKQENATVTAYDVLSCLQKNDVGGMDDFMREFGYEIKCVEDMTRFISTYNAVVNEYNDVKRCFTEEQIEELREIW